MASALPISILPQPDETTCGPTCLQTIYTFYGDTFNFTALINEIRQLEGGGTLGAILGTHALKRGYEVTIFTYNLMIFDPTWFCEKTDIIKRKLELQAEAKDNPKLQVVTSAYLEFLSLGGKIKYEVLRPSLIRRHLKQNLPLLVGLSATYLYGSKREYGPNSDYDDIRGEPSGHFVILHGYNKKTRSVWVADPLQTNPFGKEQIYQLGIDKVINAILLGVLTYDANILVITPQKSTSQENQTDA